MPFKKFSKRTSMPTLEGSQVRVTKNRISYTTELDEKIGNPKFVGMYHDSEAGRYVFAPESEEKGGYLVQRTAITTRDIACRSFISKVGIVPGVYIADIDEAEDMVIFSRDSKI
jgi:hypothetical protein